MILVPLIGICALIAGRVDAIRGVEPTRLHLYEPNVENNEKYWHCLNHPEIKLRFDQVNDDFCDYPDGSDEPGTNACPYNGSSKFYCANNGFIPGYLESFKLNDGVCDYDICCDGSDEAEGVCPDKCHEIAQQFRKFSDEANNDMKILLKIKQKLQLAVQKKVDDITKKLQILKDELKKCQQRAQESPESATDGFTLSLKELAQQIKLTNSAIEKQKSTIRSLEKILSTMMDNYNPNFNDLAVKDAIKSFQDYASNKEDVQVGNLESKLQLVSQEAQAFSSPQKLGVFSHYINKAKDYFKLEPVILEMEDDEDIAAIKQDISIYEEQLNRNYGPDDILRAIEGTWVSESLNGYTYKVGLLASIYQEDIHIGSYKAAEGTKLIYKDGSKCWNGPRRSAIVELVCGPQNRLLSVAEPEKCAYTFEVMTPVVCDSLTHEDLLANFHIDYDSL